ncbi:bcl-2-like protein 12 isoform X2 [Ambystoma mexicanum]|uniref:bcl-2-like protein 12 isoform X2 n=1 Tax=Ambystoma mexicanum TaxID=8296 RepID=UPI0037E92D51
MDASKQQPAPVMNRTRIKEETKLVLEAFLKRSLSQEGPSVGHVGRVYHDHTKYSSRSSPKGHRNGSLKHHGRSLERNGCAHIVGENEECKGIYKSGSWRSIHEEINRAEESKHGFKTGIKRLLRRHSQTKEKSHPHKLKGGETPSKSRDSLDGVLEESQIGPGRGDSLKRPKTPNLFLACAVAPSDPFDPQEQSMYVAATEKSSSQGASRKSGKSFSLKKLFKMKHSAKDTDKGLPHANRPRTLSVQHCYEEAHPERLPTAIGGDDPAIYTVAAKRLDKLVRQQKVRSPTIELQGLVFHSGGGDPLDQESAEQRMRKQIPENNNTQTTVQELNKEEVVQRLVALLQEQAVVINQQIDEDPMLRGALNRMSYRSFSRLAEVFTSQAEVPAPEELAVSPELTKIALTMELTRKVAGINSHPVQTLMGYSMEYMDMFVPWLQKQGGWESIMSQDDVLD